MRKALSIAGIILAFTAGFLAVYSVAWSQPPQISIALNFDKEFYALGDPVVAKVLVKNESGEDILINEGFSTTVFYLEIRIINPAGQLLVATREKFHDEFPDAPPLAWVLFNNRPIRVAGCEVLPAGWQVLSRSEDLGEYFNFDLPGYYSVQVQVSAMVFKGGADDPCDVNDYEWLGVLKSQTRYIYVEGSTAVNVLPRLWRIVWQDGRYLLPHLAVTIWPAEGMDIAQYDKDSIRLNDVEPIAVKKLYSLLKRQHYLLASFDKQDAINSLGEVQVRQWYDVVISGKLASGQFFGGGQKIMIVR